MCIRDSQVTIQLTTPPSELLAMGDGEKLRQAFLNILINALQATPSSGSVAIVLKQADSVIEISFQDSGTGIDEKEMERIFEPFYTTKPDGTGLGLAITKKIIEAHGGTLQVECKSGEGTTVTVALPN